MLDSHNVRFSQCSILTVFDSHNVRFSPFTTRFCSAFAPSTSTWGTAPSSFPPTPGYTSTPSTTPTSIHCGVMTSRVTSCQKRNVAGVTPVTLRPRVLNATVSRERCHTGKQVLLYFVTFFPSRCLVVTSGWTSSQIFAFRSLDAKRDAVIITLKKPTESAPWHLWLGVMVTGPVKTKRRHLHVFDVTLTFCCTSPEESSATL